jgi:hypothetical protein
MCCGPTTAQAAFASELAVSRVASKSKQVVRLLACSNRDARSERNEGSPQVKGNGLRVFIVVLMRLCVRASASVHCQRSKQCDSLVSDRIAGVLWACVKEMHAAKEVKRR